MLRPWAWPIDRTTESCIDDIQSPSMSMQTVPTNRHRVNCANLQVAWDVSQRAFTHEDWEEWARRLTVELLRQVRFKSLLTWMKHDFERFVKYRDNIFGLAGKGLKLFFKQNVEKSL